jgi:putative spermidine/putrescine transport system permease protein
VAGVGSAGVWSIVVGHTLVGIPLAIQVLVAGLAGVSPTLEKAAWTLGASKVQAFVRVTLPLTAPAIASAALLLFIFSFDNVSMSLFLSRPGSTPLPIYMYQYIQYRADPTVAAMSTILIVVGLVAAVLVGRLGGLTQLAGRSKK